MAWESALVSAVRVLNIFERFDVSRRIDRVRIDTALQTLRQIFFYSSELTAALEEIEAGRQIESEVVDYFAREFSDPPPHIQEALSFITNDRFEESNALRIEELNLMQQIRWGKLDVRREISQFFRRYGREHERDGDRLRTEAARVLGQIGRLNTAIVKLEKKLMAARSGSSPARATQRTRRRAGT